MAKCEKTSDIAQTPIASSFTHSSRWFGNFSRIVCSLSSKTSKEEAFSSSCFSSSVWPRPPSTSFSPRLGSSTLNGMTSLYRLDIVTQNRRLTLLMTQSLRPRQTSVKITTLLAAFHRSCGQKPPRLSIPSRLAFRQQQQQWTIANGCQIGHDATKDLCSPTDL